MAIKILKEASSYNWEPVLPFAVAGVLYAAGRYYRVKEADFGASAIGMALCAQWLGQNSVGGLPEKQRKEDTLYNFVFTGLGTALLIGGVAVTNLPARVQQIAFVVLGTMYLGYAYLKHQAIPPKLKEIRKEINDLSQEIEGMTPNNMEEIEKQLKLSYQKHLKCFHIINRAEVFHLHCDFLIKGLKCSPKLMHDFSKGQDSPKGRVLACAWDGTTKSPALLIEYIELLEDNDCGDLNLFDVLDGLKLKENDPEVQSWMNKKGDAIKQKWEAKAG